MFVLKLQLYIKIYYGVTFLSFMCYWMLLFSVMKRYSCLLILQKTVTLTVNLKFYFSLHILSDKIKQYYFFMLAVLVKHFLRIWSAQHINIT